MFTLSVQRAGYLLVVASGQGTLADFCGAACMVAEIGRRDGCVHALLDLLGAEPRLSLEEHRALGQHVGQAWVGMRVAVVVPDTQRVRVGESAAVDEGTNLRTFTNLLEAEGWLLAK